MLLKIPCKGFEVHILWYLLWGDIGEGGHLPVNSHSRWQTLYPWGACCFLRAGFVSYFHVYSNDSEYDDWIVILFNLRPGLLFPSFLWRFGCPFCPHVNEGHHILKVEKLTEKEIYCAHGVKSKCCAFKNKAPLCAFLTTSFLLCCKGSVVLSIIFYVMPISFKNLKSLWSLLQHYLSILVVY